METDKNKNKNKKRDFKKNDTDSFFITEEVSNY